MSRPPISRSRRPLAQRLAYLCLLPLVLTPIIARAQDAVRPSLAGETASEARRQDIERIPYNLLMGPIRFRLGASIGVEYNDNINYADDRFAEDDVIIRPQVTFNAIWPITQINTLRLDLGLSYAAYLDHSEADTNGILIAPNSQLAFDIFVGDFRINIHDRFSVQQDPIAEFAISNTVDYGRFENYAGISVLWDLNKLLLTAGYDHYTYVATTSKFDYLDRMAEQFYGSAAVNLTNTLTVGAEGSAVFTYYDQNILNDSDTYSAGAFAELQLTDNIRARVAGGYQWIDFDNNFVRFDLGPPFGIILIPDNKDLEDFYVNGLVTHQINAAFSHSVSAGHEAQLGINSNYIKLNYVRYTLNWKLIRNTLLSGEFFYEDARESGGFAGVFVGDFSGEHLHRFGGAITVGYQLTPHVTLGLRYQYTQKDSDLMFRDYTQNRVTLDGTYSF